MVIATDTQWEGREWPLERFMAVAEKIAGMKAGWSIVFLGTHAAKGRALAAYLADSPVERGIINLIGKTSFMAYVSLIAHARFVLANESSAIHIAAAASVPALAVAGGGHWGRFIPYRCEFGMERAPFIVKAFMDCYGCEWQCRFPRKKGFPVRCIEVLDEALVWKEVERILKPLAARN